MFAVFSLIAVEIDDFQFSFKEVQYSLIYF